MASWCPLFNPYAPRAMGCFIELDDGKILTGNPDQFDGKKTMVKTHGFPVDFPNKTHPLFEVRTVYLVALWPWATAGMTPMRRHIVSENR